MVEPMNRFILEYAQLVVRADRRTHRLELNVMKEVCISF